MWLTLLVTAIFNTLTLATLLGKIPHIHTDMWQLRVVFPSQIQWIHKRYLACTD